MATKFFQVGKYGSGFDQASEVPARDLSTARVITALQSGAAPAVTSAGHGMLVGDIVTFAGGDMVEIIGRHAKVVTALTNSFTIDIDTSAFTPYTTGGTFTPENPLIAGDLGLLFDDTEPSGDLLSTLARVRDRLVQLEG